MAKKFREKLRKLNPFTRPATLEELPKPLPANPDQRLVRVYVEGYEDVAFWRGIFDHFQNPYMRFEISVPNRADLPKGKKVLMGMIPRSSDELILCVDSDFDFLFADRTEQSREVNNARYMFHTYAYATENFLCYAPSLHNICMNIPARSTRCSSGTPTQRSSPRRTSFRSSTSSRRCASATSTWRTTAKKRSNGSGATWPNARRCSASATRR